jgi:hypothetical protein
MAWRDTRIALRSLIVLIWLLPLVLFAITGSLRAALEAQPLPNLVTYRDLLPNPLGTPSPVATIAPLPGSIAAAEAPNREAERTAEPMDIVVEPGEPVAGLEVYFRTVTQERDRLRRAVQDYRTTTEESRTILARVGATRKLNDEVGRGYAALAAIEPPDVAAAAHQGYLEGLALEGQALQDLLTFYSDYDAAAANRAALRLQDAREKIANATAAWDAVALQMTDEATSDRAISQRPAPTQPPDQPRQSAPRQPDQ